MKNNCTAVLSSIMILILFIIAIVIYRGDQREEELLKAEELGIIETYEEGSLNWNIALGYEKRVEKHLKKGADPNQKDMDYPLTVALKSQNPEAIIKILLKYGATETNTGSLPWEIMAYVRSWEQKELLLGSCKCRAEEWNKVLKGDSRNEYAEIFVPHFALGVAAYDGDVACISCAFDAGADVNLQDEYGRTALMFACLIDEAYAGSNKMIENKLESIKLLVEHGADVEMQNEEGKLAKDYFRKSIELIKEQNRYEDNRDNIEQVEKLLK